MENKADELQTMEFVEKIKVQIEEYVQLRTDLFKASISEKISIGFSKLITALLLLILGFFTMLFFSLVAGYFFGIVLGNTMYGFLLVAFIYLFLFILIMLFRKTLIQKPVVNAIIAIIYDDHEA